MLPVLAAREPEDLPFDAAFLLEDFFAPLLVALRAGIVPPSL
jgi:hypothetical protein